MKYDEDKIKNKIKISFFLKRIVARIGRKKPKFNHEMRNVYERVINDLPRSSNAVEAWLEIMLSERCKCILLMRLNE